MGCGASSPTADSKPVFINGKPDFEADEVVKCFQVRNGLVFRLMNSKTKEWAYYNDTKEYEVHVKVTFNQGSRIVALGNTRLLPLADDDDPENKGASVAYLTVAPLATELFVKGENNGYDAKLDAQLVDIPEQEFEEVPAES